MSEPPFLDTNIALRHLLQDEPNQSPIASALIQDLAKGNRRAWTTDLMIAEVVFVLSNRRYFNFSREDIRGMLLPIIELPGLDLATKGLYRRVFQLFTSSRIDFIDAYHAALVELRQPPELYSFDQDFDGVATVTRIDP